jgi:5,5'-dehydrodivanillate O-demethylase oxygenase subunit
MATEDDRNLSPAILKAEPGWLDFARTGPGTLGGRYLRKFWQPVHRSEDLGPGQAKPIRIMSEDFTLYRGESGTSFLLAFRCAHRGTQLSTGWVEGDNLRCLYHGWLYDGSGQCVEQPAEPTPFCQRIRVASYPTREYQGLVFAYLGEDQVPDLPEFPELEGDGFLSAHTYTWPCNYFYAVDNNVDAVHVSFTHRSPHRINGIVEYPTFRSEETEYGIRRVATYSNNSERVGHFHMPNTAHIYRGVQIPGSWLDIIVTRVPVDDEHFISFGRSFLHVPPEWLDFVQDGYDPQPVACDLSVREIGEALLRGQMGAGEVVDPARRLEIEDYVTQVGQGPIDARPAEHLGRSDEELILLRKIWSRELRALAEGRPIKKWRRPAEILVASEE